MIEIKEIEGLNPEEMGIEEAEGMLRDMEALLEEEVKKNRVSYFRPWPWQREFIEMCHKKQVVAAFLCNKIGKCLTSGTLIETPGGEISVGELYKRGEEFKVYAWDGKDRVETTALPPFKKEGLHYCYRITMSDGRIIEAADHHKILTSTGAYISVAELAQSFVSHRLSSLDTCRAIRVSGVGRSYQIQSDYRENYFENYRQYDDKPLSDRGNVRVFSPLRVDARQLFFVLCNLGERVKKYTNSLLLKFSRLSNLYGRHRLVDRSAGFLSRTFYTMFGRLNHKLQIPGQPSVAEAFGSQLSNEVFFRQDLHGEYSFKTPLYYLGNRIISFNLIGKQEVYDFTVPKYHNYCAGGLVHHNTIVAICVLISWLLGYEPWQEVDKDEEGAVKVKGRWYRGSSLKIKPPVEIKFVGEDWQDHIGSVLVPSFKEWMPVGAFKCTRKNEQGIEDRWEHVSNGSILKFMCKTQDLKKFESSRFQGLIEDEPPDREKREALNRGIFYDRGKEIITATPIREAWMLDEIILKNDPEIGVLSGYTILDNPEKYDNEKQALGRMGLTEEQMKTYFDLLIYDNPEKKTCVKDQGRKAEMFLRKLVPGELQGIIVELDILRFVKRTHPDMAPARLHGTFRALIGKIYKEYDRNVHIIKTMPVKSDWLIIPYIDWHPGTEIAIGFAALTEHGMFFVVDEIWQNMNPGQVAEILINRKIKDKWRIREVIIDSLARGDRGYIRNRQEDGKEPEDTFSIIEKKLRPHGMKLIAGSKDRNSGIVNIQTRLIGPNDIPTVYFYDSLQSNKGGYGHLFEMERWTRDEKGKIEESYNHFLVGLGWVTLSGIKWRPVKKDSENKAGRKPVNSRTGW